MIGYKNGRFVGRDCAHTVRPGEPEYRCTSPRTENDAEESPGRLKQSVDRNLAGQWLKERHERCTLARDLYVR